MGNGVALSYFDLLQIWRLHDLAWIILLWFFIQFTNGVPKSSASGIQGAQRRATWSLGMDIEVIYYHYLLHMGYSKMRITEGRFRLALGLTMVSHSLTLRRR